jgi:hypothetical protein
LCEDLAEDRLLGEVFRTDDDAVFTPRAAARQQECRDQENRKYARHRDDGRKTRASRVPRRDPLDRAQAFFQPT